MSREVDLYKDKIEVSLDGRQIFYLFFGGAVIVGLVFVLGVMVGRRVEARGHVERANVSTTVDPLAALDHLEGGNGLSFQGALRGGDAPTSDVERTIAAMSKPDAKSPAAAKLQPKVEDKKVEAKVEDKKAEAKVEEKKAEAKAEEKKAEPKVEAKLEPKKADEKKTDAKVDEKKADSKKSDTKAEGKTDAKKTESKTADVKSDDKKSEAKAEAKAEAKTDEKKTEAKSDEKKQKFTLQLSSFQDKNEAQAYLDAIKASGYSAYVTEGEVDGKQFFRVRMGSYKSMDAATEAKVEFEKSAKKTAIITKL